MKKKILFTIVAIIFINMIALPLEVKAATLQDYIDKVAAFKAKVDEAQSAINKTEAQITATKNEINSINAEMKQMVVDIERMHKEIDKYNEEIKEKSLQTKQLFQYLQVSEGENLYLEYIFGAHNITDLIYRMSIVEQLTDYNEKTIQKLEKMIEANKKREKELKQKEVELEKKKVVLANKISSLEGEKVSINAGAVSSREQLKIYQDTVANYQKLGCKPTDVIGVDCAKAASVAGFYRPTATGRITGEMGERDLSVGGNTFHLGLDIGSNNGRGEKIYPIATGTIKRIYYDLYKAKMVLIHHYDATTGKSYSSLYAHLSSWSPNIYEGKTVSPDEYIGYMGDTGFAFGVHLHLEVADCKLYDPTDRNCSGWNSYANYVENRYYQGFKGARSLIYFPSRWYSRT